MAENDRTRLARIRDRARDVGGTAVDRAQSGLRETTNRAQSGLRKTTARAHEFAQESDLTERITPEDIRSEVRRVGESMDAPERAAETARMGPPVDAGLHPTTSPEDVHEFAAAGVEGFHLVGGEPQTGEGRDGEPAPLFDYGFGHEEGDGVDSMATIDPVPRDDSRGSRPDDGVFGLSFPDDEGDRQGGFGLSFGDDGANSESESESESEGDDWLTGGWGDDE